MKLSEHKILKKEILALPPKEKDKLLLRLVAKDKVLTEHLHFLLLEDETDLADRVLRIKSEILSATKKQANVKETLTDLRKLVKLVNHNLKVTKANFEDVELRIYLFNNINIRFKSGIFSSYKNYEQLFANYFVKSILMTLKKFDKLHEDLQFDLKDELDLLLSKVYKSNMASTANALNLPEHI